ncbi:hypothetical protein [Nakamurella endophytica]|uniref:hypothetical protein n=1 Tax=Nakamurella endophytica TaxID=1748367 RepID=UPI001E5FAB28|nr:hypothetical protein [Nakamurella endophytica]
MLLSVHWVALDDSAGDHRPVAAVVDLAVPTVDVQQAAAPPGGWIIGSDEGTAPGDGSSDPHRSALSRCLAVSADSRALSVPVGPVDLAHRRSDGVGYLRELSGRLWPAPWTGCLALVHVIQV